MRRSAFLGVAILIAHNVHAQDYVRSQPAGRDPNAFRAVADGLVAETGEAARDLVTFRDPKWIFLTIAQIAAATADTETSLHNFRICPRCVEIGIPRLVVGRRPDAHKYAIEGLVEIGVEAVTAHYLHKHGPIRKWYWRYVWILPQTFSLFEHTRASFHNVGLQLRCDSTGLNCY
jgi:hypothetical protein